MKSKDQIHREFVRLTFLRGHMALRTDDLSTRQLANLDGQLTALQWVLGAEYWNPNDYGA